MTPDPKPTPSRVASLRKRAFALQEIGPLAALALIVAVIGINHSQFLSEEVAITNLRAASIVALVAFGMVFLLTMGEIDLSVGGIYGVSFFLAAKWMVSIDPYVAAILATAVGAGMGAVNGLLTAVFRAPVIIVTLGTYSLYGGLVHVVSGGQTTGQLPVDSSFFRLGEEFLGLPVVAWVTVVVGAVLTFVMHKTRFGALVRASGSNREAAEFSGVPVARIRFHVLTLTGALAGLSGVLSLAYFQGGDPTIGGMLALQVIAAAIIGGTAIHGGAGSVPGALIGALIVTVIASGLVFFSINPLWSDVVTGAVIIIAVGSDALIRHRRQLRRAAGA